MTITFSQSDLERIIAAEVRRLFPGASQVGPPEFDCDNDISGSALTNITATLDATIEQPPA